MRSLVRVQYRPLSTSSAEQRGCGYRFAIAMHAWRGSSFSSLLRVGARARVTEKNATPIDQSRSAARTPHAPSARRGSLPAASTRPPARPWFDSTDTTTTSDHSTPQSAASATPGSSLSWRRTNAPCPCSAAETPPSRKSSTFWRHAKSCYRRPDGTHWRACCGRYWDTECRFSWKMCCVAARRASD